MTGLRIRIDRNHDSAIVTAPNINGRKADEGLLAFAPELYNFPYGGGAVMDDGAMDVIPNLMQLVAG